MSEWSAEGRREASKDWLAGAKRRRHLGWPARSAEDTKNSEAATPRITLIRVCDNRISKHRIACVEKICCGDTRIELADRREASKDLLRLVVNPQLKTLTENAILAQRFSLLLGTRSSLDRPITPVCVFFVLSRFYFYTLSEYTVIIVWYDTLLHHSSVRWQLTTTLNCASRYHTHDGVFCSLCIFFSQRISTYDVLLCRVAATDSQFPRRPSPMTVCFCTSLSIFFVLS